MFNFKILNSMASKLRISKEKKQLLIAMLLGDGTISSNYVFKLCHGKEQEEYLKWKIQLLDIVGIKNNGLKTYVSSAGFNEGKEVIYSQLSIIPTIKALRRTVYKPKKIITRNLLNWLNELGIAIWFMDDGCINVNTSKQRKNIQHTIKIATCTDVTTTEIIIKYFIEVWNIKFRKFPEGNGYSIATSSEEDCINFVKIVKPFVKQVPSLLYKIRNNYTKEEFIALQARSAEHLDEMMI